MTAQDLVWILKENFLVEMTSQLRSLLCAKASASASNRRQSPSSLEIYVRLMDYLCDNEDDNLVDSVEEDLQHWVLGPFLPIFDQIEPTLLLNQYPLALQDYRFP